MYDDTLTDEQKQALAREFAEADKAFGEATERRKAAVIALRMPLLDTEACVLVAQAFHDLDIEPYDSLAVVMARNGRREIDTRLDNTAFTL